MCLHHVIIDKPKGEKCLNRCQATYVPFHRLELGLALHLIPPPRCGGCLCQGEMQANILALQTHLGWSVTRSGLPHVYETSERGKNSPCCTPGHTSERRSQHRDGGSLAWLLKKSEAIGTGHISLGLVGAAMEMTIIHLLTGKQYLLRPQSTCSVGGINY